MLSRSRNSIGLSFRGFVEFFYRFVSLLPYLADSDGKDAKLALAEENPSGNSPYLLSKARVSAFLSFTDVILFIPVVSAGLLD